jgi:hypothetical protein
MSSCSPARGRREPRKTSVEAAPPETLKLGGEFVGNNLGSALEPNGDVTMRAIGQPYSFRPQFMLIPTDALTTFRATGADVVYGFLIDATSVNIRCSLPATTPASRRASPSPGSV